MHASFVFPIVLLAFAVNSGESIKCYSCNTLTDPKCVDPFITANNNDLLHECTPNLVKQAGEAFNAASKKFSEIASSIGFDTNSNKALNVNVEFSCAKIDYTQNDKTWSVRQCAPPANDKIDFCKQLMDLSKDSPNAPKPSFCEICDKDGCNGASSIQAAFLALLVPCIALILAQLQ